MPHIVRKDEVGKVLLCDPEIYIESAVAGYCYVIPAFAKGKMVGELVLHLAWPPSLAPVPHMIITSC